MSSSWLLLALLALAYLGSYGASSATVRVLPARWSLYLVVGYLLGPAALGVLQPSALEDFAVVGQVGAAWLALVTGLAFELTGRASLGRFAASTTISTLGGGVVGAVAGYGAMRVLGFDGSHSILIGGAIGVVLAPTATLCAASIEAGDETERPVARALLEVSRDSALVPVVGAALLVAFAPDHGLVDYSLATRFAVTLVTGGVLGVLAVALLGRELRSAESWGLLLGLTLLGSGTAERVGLSAVAVAFVLGLTISALSRHRRDIRAMTAPTEPSVLLPIALLVGAGLNLELAWLLPVSVVCALRLAVDWLRGNLLRWWVPALRPTGHAVGLTLAMPGALMLALAVELSHRLPSGISQSVLVAIVAAALSGDLLASRQLKRSLALAGEKVPQSSSNPAPKVMPDAESTP